MAADTPAARRAARMAAQDRARQRSRVQAQPDPLTPVSLPVDVTALAPTGSYDTPEFQRRGTYEDLPFNCRDCGVPQVWTAAQQRWWYEVARGDRFTTAIRCRPCRRAERERVDAQQARSTSTKAP